jgi:hypothetical protein
MLQTAGETKALKPVVSEGAGIRSIREQMLKPGAAKCLTAPFWATQSAVRTTSGSVGRASSVRGLPAMSGSVREFAFGMRAG